MTSFTNDLISIQSNKRKNTEDHPSRNMTKYVNPMDYAQQRGITNINVYCFTINIPFKVRTAFDKLAEAQASLNSQHGNSNDLVLCHFCEKAQMPKDPDNTCVKCNDHFCKSCSIVW